MHEFRMRPIARAVSPRHPAESQPRPRADLVDVFARLLPGVVVTPATFRSETALAGQLRVDPRRIREIRCARLVAPCRLGRGWVYGPEEIRTLSVMLALVRLGATLADLTTFFGVSDRDHERTGADPSRAPIPLCTAFCERLAARMEEEIARLRALEALFDTPLDAPNATTTSRPEDRIGSEIIAK